MKKRVFLDNAATTPIAPEIIELISDMMKTHFANPSSIHSYGRESKIVVESARKTIANLLNTSPGSIFFTSGGTEADNMAIKCAIHDHKIKHAITSKLSHHAVLYPLEDLASEGKHVSNNTQGSCASTKGACAKAAMHTTATQGKPSCTLAHGSQCRWHSPFYKT